MGTETKAMLDIVFDIDDNFLFREEPMQRVTPEEVYEFLRENDDDYSLCYAFFGVFNEGVYLTSEINYTYSENNIPLINKRSDWAVVERFILLKILERMGIGLNDGEPPFGYYYVVKPFMEKNGFLADYEIYII